MKNISNYLSISLLIIISVGISSCASTTHLNTARFYNLDTGEVLNGSYENYGTGHGKITVVTSDGNQLSGEYNTAIDAASVRDTGGYAWATEQGFSFNQPGKQFGSAILEGNGLVIDIIYAVDPWSSLGHGVGKDNKGGRYKIQF